MARRWAKFPWPVGPKTGRYHEIPDELWNDGALKRGLDLLAAEHPSQLWPSIRTTRANSAT